MSKFSLWLCLVLTSISTSTLAQTDTLKLVLKQAEQLFLKNNHELLAGNYQIDQARADLITAKLFDNPELEYENLFYNHETRKFLQTSYTYGQFATSISQLVKLAGKRDKNIKLAQTGIKLAELEYFDLIRALKFELERSFYKTYYDQQSLQVYQKQIDAAQQLLNAYNLQLQMGNVAQKEVIRIKSLVINLKSELTSLLNDVEDDLRDLKLLCGIPPTTVIQPLLSDIILSDQPINKFSYLNLLDSAKNNRADLKLAQETLQYNEQQLRLQKAMAIPDVEVSLSYDLKGNYPEKYTGLGLKIPIPLFNRNQGEIRKARLGIDAAQTNIKRQELLLANEVYNSYLTALRNEKRFQEIDPGFHSDFNKLITGLITNFKARNISLIEFLDLYDSYKENTLQLNTIGFERMSSRAEINYVTGANIFK